MMFANWLQSFRFAKPSAKVARSRRRCSTRRPIRLRLTGLEDRTLLSAYVVTTTADSGVGSLRDAINQINADTNHALYASPSNPGVDEIDFNITASSDTGGSFNASTGVATIQPQSTLPTVTNSVIINGYSQPGSSMNTLPCMGSGAGDNAVQDIIVDGTSLSGGSYNLGPYDNFPDALNAVEAAAPSGLVIAADNTTVSGLAIGNFKNTYTVWLTGGGGFSGDYGAGVHLISGGNTVAGNYIPDTAQGVLVDNVPNNIIGGVLPAARNVLNDITISGAGATGNVLECNYIGTDGHQLLSGHGVYILYGASSNVVGGTTPGAGNVIAGGSTGIEIGEAQSNVVQGNYIGLDASGTTVLGPGLGWGGVWIIDSTNNTIGGSTPEARNVISGFTLSNVDVDGSNEDVNGYPAGQLPGLNLVQGNYIGTDATGTVVPINASGSGVGILETGLQDTIGGTGPGEGNVISGNPWGGVGIEGGGSDTVEGNLIGTDTSGTAPLANGYATSSWFDGGWGLLISGNNNLITGNTIAHNDGTGVGIWGQNNSITGNTIASNSGPGVWLTGDFFTRYWAGDPIQGNSIYGNTGRGIVLADVPVDVNGNPTTDPNLWDHEIPSPYPTGTPDGLQTWCNDSQIYPRLSAATSGTGCLVSGTLNSQPNTTFSVDVYASPSVSASDYYQGHYYGEGQYYLGQASVTTDANGNASFAADFSVANLPGGTLPDGWYISATATDRRNNTSEFSADVVSAAATQSFSQYLQAALPQDSSSPMAIAIQTGPNLTEDTVISAVNGLTAPSVALTIALNLNGGTYNDTTVSPPANVTLVIVGASGTNTFVGHSPAFTITGGTVIIRNVAFTTATDAPTILVTGGSLTLRNDVVQESTGYTDAAILVTGGTLDLGTAAEPGGNTLNVHGTGELVHNTTASTIPAVGDTFTLDGTPLPAPSLSFTTIAASTATTPLNQPVTFTVSVQVDGAGTPSGSVGFVDTTTGTDLGSVAIAGGTATLTTTVLTAGSHVVEARYSGDGTFLPSLDRLAVNVVYQFSGFLAPLGKISSFALGRSVPIKFQLTDYLGNELTDLADVRALNVNGTLLYNGATGQSQDSTNGQGLYYDATAHQFIFNWQTKGFAAGSYTITLLLADGTSHVITVQLGSASGSAGLTTDTAGGTSSSAGALLGGDVTLYVDNSNGDMTADELARVNDAVAAVDATIAPYGVTIAEVSDPALADATLTMDSTSSVGGYADGVLGCTTDSGQVTIIAGWNFYTGSDATQIGSGQYDFQTVVTHELGHVLGLGHSAAAASVMYATLDTGVAKRTLVAADLNVPDADGGSCGLHAQPQPFAPVASVDALFASLAHWPRVGMTADSTSAAAVVSSSRVARTSVPWTAPAVPLWEAAGDATTNLDALFAQLGQDGSLVGWGLSDWLSGWGSPIGMNE